MRHTTKNQGLRRATLVAVLTGMLVGLGGGTAWATRYSGWVNAINLSYQYQSWVNDSPKSAGGQVRAMSGNLGGDHAGIIPRLYKSTAVCAQATNWVFNSVGVSMFSSSVAGDCGTGTYRSNSSYRIWHGSGYQEYTLASPNQSW